MIFRQRLSSTCKTQVPLGQPLITSRFQKRPAGLQPLEHRAGPQHTACATQGMLEPAGEPCWGQDMATALVHQQRTGFTFRSVLRIQMNVQTLGLLGHFSTMNPPGPFSPLWGTKSTQSEPGPDEKLFANALGCTAPILR